MSANLVPDIIEEHMMTDKLSQDAVTRVEHAVQAAGEPVVPPAGEIRTGRVQASNSENWEYGINIPEDGNPLTGMGVSCNALMALRGPDEKMMPRFMRYRYCRSTHRIWKKSSQATRPVTRS